MTSWFRATPGRAFRMSHVNGGIDKPAEGGRTTCSFCAHKAALPREPNQQLTTDHKFTFCHTPGAIL